MAAPTIHPSLRFTEADAHALESLLIRYQRDLSQIIDKDAQSYAQTCRAAATLIRDDLKEGLDVGVWEAAS